MRSLAIEIGAGCSARLSWPGEGFVVIEVLNADGERMRGYRGRWEIARIRQARQSELRHIVFLAVRTGRTPPWEKPRPARIGEVLDSLLKEANHG